MKYPSLALLFTFIVTSLSAHAQEAITTAGGNASHTRGSITYSVGQIAYTNIHNDKGGLQQGVQQAFEITTLKMDKNQLHLDISLYPNPSDANIMLEIPKFETNPLEYRLYDVKGTLLFEGKVTEVQTTLSTSQLPSAAYYLQISQLNSQNKQGFQIIKK